MFARLYIANDHGGYAAKVLLVKYLTDKGIDAENLGSDTEHIVRYPYYAARAVKKVLNNPRSGAILICSTGIGMSIIANKFRGIRAALCTSGFMAEATRKHNDANVLCLGAKVSGEFEIYNIVDNWLSNEFEGGRHNISIGLINEAERDMRGSDECNLCRVRKGDEL